MKIDTARYRETFFDEAGEHLSTLEAALLKLDAGLANADAVDAAFRAMHSVKGGADAVGFPAIAQFTHVLEELFDHFRAHPGPVSRPMLDLVLEAADVLTELIRTVRRAEPPPETENILARLEQARRAPEPTASLTTYSISVVPHEDSLRTGLDPIPLFRELASLGKVLSVRLNAKGLPPLAQLDPEKCYLAWTISLQTHRSRQDLDDVFSFAGTGLAVTIEDGARPVSPEPVAKPAAKPATKMPSNPVDPLWFGAFLCQRGVLTSDQLGEVLDQLRRCRHLVGVQAIQEGLLSPEQMTDVLASMRSGERFGEAAVRMGYLSESDLWQLYLIHQEQVPSISVALLEAGLLDPAKLAAEESLFLQSIANKKSEAEAVTETAAQFGPAHTLPIDYKALGENAEMIAEFCTEADDHLTTADRHLLELDANPHNKQAVDAIYRGFHTIKGVSSMLGLRAVQMLAHEAENLLNLARDGKILLRARAMDMAFAATDGLKRQFGFVRDWLRHRGLMDQDPLLDQLLKDLRSIDSAEASAPIASAAPLASPAESSGKPAVDPGPVVAPAPLLASSPSPLSAISPSPLATNDDSSGPHARRAGNTEKETVRVDRDRLDKLINSIGELVIAQSMAQAEFDELAAKTGAHPRALQELSKISQDLQELGLSLRMVPLQGIFQKMARLVRDLSRKMNKPVELAAHGEETELDKTVVDQLGDPLMHMVRNAVDHGLEPPEERLAAGKPAEEQITLRAYHQGGNVYIELTDDGRGLNRDRILQKGIEKGLVTEGQRLSDAEIYALIFAPGFSTAAAVTDVSGRGVGMDVVRRNVEALQGNILIRTQLGKGTTFTIRLPLTLAIMEGLMVGVGEDVYLLPLLSVVESFRPRARDVHVLGGRREVVSVRGEVIPLLRLYQLLGRPGRVSDPCLGLVVLVEDEGKKHALLVDELLGQMQAVVKSLDTNFRKVEGLAGATILGDGRVAMILDVHGLTQIHVPFGSGNFLPASMTDSYLPLGELT